MAVLYVNHYTSGFIIICRTFQETYEEYIADQEIKLEKSQDEKKQLHLQKSQAETELRKVSKTTVVIRE